DWQLLPWILGRRHAAGGASPKGALPPVGRWKMFDNLRRSLTAPAGVAALFAGWMLPFDVALGWTGFVVATIAAPPLLPLLAAIMPRTTRVSSRSHFAALGDDVSRTLSQIGLLLAFIANQSSLMMDAIGRTLFRLVV